MKTLAHLINEMDFQESLELAKEIVDSRLAAILSVSDHVRRVVAIENNMSVPEEKDTVRDVSVTGIENPGDITVYYSRDATHRFLLELGVKPHIKGFKYLESILKLLHKDETYLDKVTVLYYIVSRMHSSTAGGVERSIRHLISVLSEENLLKIVPTYEGHCTNKEFITYLLLLYKEYVTHNH